MDCSLAISDKRLINGFRCGHKMQFAARTRVFLRLKVLATYKVVRDLIVQQITMALASFLPHESGEEPK